MTEPCSFCGAYCELVEGRHVRVRYDAGPGSSLVRTPDGAAHRPTCRPFGQGDTRICDDCVGLCGAILAEKVGMRGHELAASQLTVEWIDSVIRQLGTQALDHGPHGSVCGVDSGDWSAMVRGPQVAICEACIRRGVSVFVSAT